MNGAWPALEQAAGDRSSGAAQIARAAALALARLQPADARRALEVLLRGHPSMAPLWRLATDVTEAGGAPAAAERFLTLLARDGRAAEALAPALPDEILTISWSSSVVAALRARRPRVVRCMVSEPGGEGRRLAEAVSAVAPAVEVLDDEDAIARMPAAAVVVGADAVTEGGIVNKVKTRGLLQAAARAGIPRYAVAGETKFLADRPPIEPVLELAPLELLTAVAAPDGLLSPAEGARRARGAAVHPALRDLLRELGGVPAGGSVPS